MVNGIRIYVEGGGNDNASKVQLRQGFNRFFRELIDQARSRRRGWDLIRCGSRTSAFDKFKNALQFHPNAFNVLLVDAEGPVASGPWEHLRTHSGDQWTSPGVDDGHCHLMVQAMEAWFLADVEALKRFYGQGFRANAIPKNPNVESIANPETGLKDATRKTSKGEYHKIRHPPKLFEIVDVAKVRCVAAHCERLFATLDERLKSGV